MKTGPGQHVEFFRFEPASKVKPAGYVTYPATALTEPNTEGKIQLSFYHESGQRHLGGADWADAFLRADDVAPEKGHGQFVSFWRPMEDYKQTISDMNKGIDILKKQLAETTEGRDKALQEIADANATKDKKTKKD